MNEPEIIQGRKIGMPEIEAVRTLIANHPKWSRWRLSRELCSQWNWCDGVGAPKDMAARTLLLKLAQRGYIQLPERRQTPTNRMRCAVRELPQDEAPPLRCPLGDLGPLKLEEVSTQPAQRRELAGVLRAHHYLGYGGPVGQNMQYTVRTSQGRLLAVAVFGAAAWKCAPRDQWIGWSAQMREQRLGWVANNSRFLILPGVEVPHLASHTLGRIARRIGADWQRKYGQPVVLLETFVENGRFAGTCYRAANWRHVGQTQGRSRQDRAHKMEVPTKAVWLYPLESNFKGKLCP